MDRIKDIFIRLKDNTVRTLTMLENLLNWSLEQQDEIKCQQEKINVNEIVFNNIDLLNDLAKKKSISLVNNINKDLSIIFDKEMFDIIIKNLINNAIKYTKENGKIEIKNKKEEDSIYISVEDTGIGLTKEQLDLILDKEKIYTTYGTKNEKGTGLGLNLVKSFLEKNNSKLIIKSEIGKGSEFIISIPCEYINQN